jgi:hypothetical protein
VFPKNLKNVCFVIVGFTNPVNGEVYSIQHYVIKFVSDMRQVSGFLQVLWFPPPIKLTPPRYNSNIVESGVKHHKSTNQPHKVFIDSNYYQYCVSQKSEKCLFLFILSQLASILYIIGHTNVWTFRLMIPSVDCIRISPGPTDNRIFSPIRLRLVYQTKTSTWEIMFPS